jgi:translation initiation factor IF-3
LAYFERRPTRDLPNINERIRAREVRLISETGEMLGVVPTIQAVRMAKEKGYDLVLVSALDTVPPVAKIMDYGKYKFETEKKAREARKKHHTIVLKEIKMSYKIEKHDYQVNVKKAEKFLTTGDKVKVTVQLRGREMEHKNLAIDVLKRFLIDTATWGTAEKPPKMEGKTALLILVPGGLPQKK